MSLNIPTPRYCKNPAGDPFVHHHLNLIRESILHSGIPALSLVLCGSYGRGEGAIIKNGNTWQPVNDYDIFVVTEAPLPLSRRRILKRLGAKLAEQLQLPHIDLMSTTATDLSALPLSMIRFNLFSACITFWGDSTVTLSPKISEPPFPKEEIRNLLINRALTLLEGFPLSLKANRGHCARQISKAIWSAVDSLLYQKGAYQTRYNDKRREIENMDLKGLLSSEEISWAEAAFFVSLDADNLSEKELINHWEKAKELLLTQLIEISSQIDNNGYRTIRELFPLWRGQRWIEALPAQLALYIQLRPSRRKVEQDITLHLSNYDASKEWASGNQKLISKWYRS